MITASVLFGLFVSSLLTGPSPWFTLLYPFGLAGVHLLYGPPGCGKTRVARVLAGETDHAFLEISPTDITSRYVGQAADNVASVFETARENELALLNVPAVLDIRCRHQSLSILD